MRNRNATGSGLVWWFRSMVRRAGLIADATAVGSDGAPPLWREYSQAVDEE